MIIIVYSLLKNTIKSFVYKYVSNINYYLPFTGTKTLQSTEMYDPMRTKHWSQLNNLSKPLAGLRLACVDNLANRSQFGYYGHRRITDRARRSYIRRKAELRIRLAVLGRDNEVTESEPSEVDSEEDI